MNVPFQRLRVIGLGAAALALSACGAQQVDAGRPGGDGPDKPIGTDVPPDDVPSGPAKPMRPKVVWKGATLVVTAFGSSSCPPVASQASATSAHRLRIILQQPPDDQPCTDDYGPHRSRVASPSSGIDLGSPVTARLVQDGDDPLVRVRLRD